MVLTESRGTWLESTNLQRESDIHQMDVAMLSVIFLSGKNTIWDQAGPWMVQKHKLSNYGVGVGAAAFQKFARFIVAIIHFGYYKLFVVTRSINFDQQVNS